MKKPKRPKFPKKPKLTSSNEVKEAYFKRCAEKKQEYAKKLAAYNAAVKKKKALDEKIRNFRPSV